MSKGGFDLDRIGGRRALAELIDEVLVAGDAARRMYEAGMIRWTDRTRVERKPDRSPVTEADRAVEERLSGFLRRRYPDTAFLGEETGESGPETAGMRWVLDPIDGTRAFVRGTETWSVLLGLLADGHPVLGIAYMPAAEDLFWAVRGDGAWGNGRPLAVSRVGKLEDATISHGTLQQFTGAAMVPALQRLGERTESQRGFGDFDGYRRLLRGQVDAMIDPAVMPWDVCAASVLVHEAGGVLTSFDGQPTIFGGGAVASNGLFHKDLLALLDEPSR
ncbi:inositol monophosphatase family protein [Sandaracinus amylolyticus]|uniref:Histidinol-phosphatase n=1 Tax=Sandaracinus amylolyticus TaxID=927083 RepID=A0A0F6YJV4_9BACT|nr:inositol monophosphatase family protein [Sandaracinus amylolyticus]AKF08547.1 Histidinol-phosphatase [Sandaracinus amylolyticus]